jgi:hypothetical protein
MCTRAASLEGDRTIAGYALVSNDGLAFNIFELEFLDGVGETGMFPWRGAGSNNREHQGMASLPLQACKVNLDLVQVGAHLRLGRLRVASSDRVVDRMVEGERASGRARH